MDTIVRLEKSLHHDDPEVRWIALSDLETIEGDEATDLLIGALNDGDFKSIRWKAAIVLGDRGDSRATVALIAALKDDNYHVREEAATALGKIADARAVEPLIALLHDPVRSVRLRGIRALERIGEPASKPLNRALEAENKTFHEAVSDALSEIEDSRVRKQSLKGR
jgi:HEAT repeat protein